MTLQLWAVKGRSWNISKSFNWLLWKLPCTVLLGFFFLVINLFLLKRELSDIHWTIPFPPFCSFSFQFFSRPFVLTLHHLVAFERRNVLVHLPSLVCECQVIVLILWERVSVFESQKIVLLKRRKQPKPCGWQTARLRVVGGFIVICQPAEESDDGSLLGALCSQQPVMALSPGFGFLLTANQLWQPWPC